MSVIPDALPLILPAAIEKRLFVIPVSIRVMGCELA
jgi:hypothetical protein